MDKIKGRVRLVTAASRIWTPSTRKDLHEVDEVAQNLKVKAGLDVNLSHPVDTFTDDDDDPTYDELKDLFGNSSTAHLFEQAECVDTVSNQLALA
eukprot:SAG31_NODE_58_length_29669_cov_20.244978_3_plen_95_part_00